MEERRLVRMGKSSLGLTLPKRFVTHNRLKPGRTVYLIESDELVIYRNKITGGILVAIEEPVKK